MTGASADHLAGLRVRIETLDEQHRPGNLNWEKGIEISGRAAGVTDEKGEFVAAEVATGIARLNVTSDPALPLRLKLPDDVHVTAGQTTKVEIPLVPAGACAGWCVPSQTANRWLAPEVAVNHTFRELGPPESEEVRTDADGRFEAYVLPGQVGGHVIGKVPGLMPEEGPGGWWQQREDVAAQEGVVELKPIELVASKTIKGRLVDQFNHPLAGVTIHAGNGPRGGYGWAETESDGSFSLDVPADADPTYRISQRRVGAIDADVVQRDPLVLRADGVSTVEEVIRRTAKLRNM